MNKKNKVMMFTGIGLLIVSVFIAGTLLFQWLWNWLMPLLFGLPSISFWQVLGLRLMVTMLTWNYAGKSGCKCK